MKALCHHIATIGLGVLLCMVVSCRSQRPTTIAFVPRTTGTELWEAAHTSADRAALALDKSVYWNAPTREDDVQGQVMLVNQVIQRPLLGLIVSPDNTLALLGTLKQAEDRGLPVAVVQSDLPLPASALRGYFVNDEQAVGDLIAGRVGAALGGHGGVAILGNDRTSGSLFSRLMSIQKALQLRPRRSC